MQMNASIEGKTETTWQEWNGFNTETETKVILLNTSGGTTNDVLDANDFLMSIAKLVPTGTILRLTVETVDPLA